MLTDNPGVPLILVVEDNENHAELIRRSFDDDLEEYRLNIVASFVAAKKAIMDKSPALVLTDFRLPDGFGSDLVVMSRGLWPVVIMTSQGNEQIAVEAIKIGAQDYIVKSPDSIEKMPRAVKYALLAWELIVARQQASEAVLHAKKDWERTFDAVPDLISIIDLEYNITRVNKAMVARCGVTPEEMVGKKCYEVVHGLKNPPDFCPVAVMIKDGMAQTVETNEKGLQGYFDVTVSPLADGEGRITTFVHVMRDITERKRTEEERQLLERQLQHTQKLESLGVLSGGIAHDFNNILTIILGHCYVLKGNTDSDIDQDAHLLMIESAANRAADLCRQMLAYAGESQLLQTKFNMVSLVHDVVRMLSSAIKKNVAITLDVNSEIPAIIGDSSQIQQVIMNLIINASEAIGDNNGIITVRLDKRDVPATLSEIDYFGGKILSGSYVCLEVSDTGCGMSEETRQRIFEPFYTTKFPGRGLGMSVILGIIQAHNGTLQLMSTPDIGSLFRIYIPLNLTKEAAESQTASDVIEASLSDITVLLVDDEVTLRTIVTELLEALGISVISAVNGREALQLYAARGTGIDMIMLDLVMPEMGGVEAYHELRKIDPSVPIILCSGYGAEAVSDILKGDDRVDFLHKPYNHAGLRRILSEKTGR